jgi:predicted RNA binding protein YcfA (HicA-like mRNA interferase family)
MTEWRAVRARQVLATLQRTGWRTTRQRGLHRVLVKEGRPNFVAFHDREEIGPKMLARIARHTGLRAEDL